MNKTSDTRPKDRKKKVIKSVAFFFLGIFLSLYIIESIKIYPSVELKKSFNAKYKTSQVFNAKNKDIDSFLKSRTALIISSNNESLISIIKSNEIIIGNDLILVRPFCHDCQALNINREPYKTFNEATKDKMSYLKGNDKETGFDDFSIGSASAIHKDGYYLTAKHVINSKFNKLILFNKGEFLGAFPVRIVGKFREIDMALIHIDHKLDKIFEISASDKQNEIVSSFGVTGRTSGTTACTHKEKNWAEYVSSAPCIPGDSGGPTINMRGELIGINLKIGHQHLNINPRSTIMKINKDFLISIIEKDEKNLRHAYSNLS